MRMRKRLRTRARHRMARQARNRDTGVINDAIDDHCGDVRIDSCLIRSDGSDLPCEQLGTRRGLRAFVDSYAVSQHWVSFPVGE